MGASARGGPSPSARALAPVPPMILCVTLNPCLDKTLVVPAWSPGESIRGLSVREVVGGKGNNVARALTRLGRGDVRPATFLGGPVGHRCAQLLAGADGLDPIVVPTAAPTRQILTARTEGSADQTAFFDPDPAISEAEAGEMLAQVEAELSSDDVQALTLSGSSPAAPTHGLFAAMIALARAHAVPCFLDTYGPALAAIGGAWPDAIQLNVREAAIYLGRPGGRPSTADLLAMLARWGHRGVAIAVVTDGPRPVLARVGRSTYRVTPPPIVAVNPIGSGDCFLAGLVDAHLAGLGPEATLRHASGCAVANAMVWDAGGIDAESARGWEGRVVVEAVGS